MALMPARATLPAPGWPLALLALGLACMLGPTLLVLAEQSWSREEGVHGPIVIATGGWLIWRRRVEIAALARPGRGLPLALGIAVALAIYIFGRAYDFLSLEAAGMLLTLLATAYGIYGVRVLQLLWFPILYLMFLVPMPGWAIDTVTAPLKAFVSYSAERLLSGAGIEIVRQGVVLWVDQYQLLVKDACAGLNSLFSLAAISLFYIYLRHNASWRYALFLLLWVVPAAILANIVRVILLVLITHFWGEAAAQGFLHNTAGMLMFVVALMGIIALDGLFSVVCSRWRRA